MEKLDAEQNLKLKEIFDILLSAGYFRCRIPGITIFDKILGGMAWCITCSNFDIDIDFSEDMNLGQKIKISEKVVNSLKQMNCPYTIGAHQIQGMDLKNIYPIIQWLIKFVLETRDLRQDFNKSVSQFEGSKVYYTADGKPVYEAEPIIKAEKSIDKRVNKNAKVENFKIADPVRVYSNLIEFDDKTARRTYNRLVHFLSAGAGGAKNKDARASLRQSIIKRQKGSITPSMTSPTKPGQQQDDGEDDIDIFVAENENLAAEGEIQDEEFSTMRLERKNSMIKESLSKYVERNKANLSKNLQNAKDETDELDFAALIQSENRMFEEQKTLIGRQIDKTTKDIAKRQETYGQYEQHLTNLGAEKAEIDNLNRELEEAASVINGKIDGVKQEKGGSSADTQKIAGLIKERNRLKQEKSELKKDVKAQMARLEEQKSQIEGDWQEYSGPIDDEVLHDYNRKKDKYDEKYKQFAQVNQEIAVLQRKIENYPSAIEIAQYQKRLIELFDQMNVEMERYRDQYAKFNSLQDIRTTQENNTQLMRSFKEGLQNTGKSKSKKDKFVKDLQQAFAGLQENLEKSKLLLNKTKAQKDKNFEGYTSLLKLEREYYRILRELQIEFEKSEAANE